jgi:hypothetical protein
MLCSKCLEEKPVTLIEGKYFCKSCANYYSFSKDIFEARHGKEVKKEIVAKCYECPNFIYNTDSPHKFLRNFGFEYFFTNSETEEINLCEKCYKKRLIEQKKRTIIKRILFFCIGFLLFLLFLLSYQEKLKEL